MIEMAKKRDEKDIHFAFLSNAEDNSRQMLDPGKQIFRIDTFCDQAFWGDQLQLHEAVNGLSPRNALALGLKVDADALSPSTVEAIKHGKVNLEDPAVTRALIKQKAVVGVVGFFNNNSDKLRSIGLTCAVCHSTVDDSIAPGIGRRIDGLANRDLNVGAIAAAAPKLTPVQQLLQIADPNQIRQVLLSWGPGKFDAELFLDGKAFQPDGRSAATLIPNAFGLAGVNLHTYTGWGSVTYWNAFVANLEMHGQGNFTDSRLSDPVQFPIAARAGFAKVRNDDDQITPKLAALHAYQLSIPAPTPPAGSFNADAAERGDDLFNGKAKCSNCHMEPLFTEPGWNMHAGSEIGIDEFQAQRAPDKKYRTSPLKGL